MPDKSFQLLLLRHGQTDSNAGGVLQGHLPVPLNETGLRQAKQLAARIARWTPAVRIWMSSDLLRAKQTALELAAAMKIEPIFDAGWRERGLGELEGKTVGEKRVWQVASGEETPRGAETVAAFGARVLLAIEQTKSEFHDRGPVAVVTHGGPIRVILRMLCDGRLPLAKDQIKPEVEMIDNCAIWVLEFQDGAWRVACANDVSHLSDKSDRDVG